MNNMVTTTVRIDSETKRMADDLFADFGLNFNTAINIFLKQVIKDGAIPFRIGNPQYSAATMRAFKETEDMIKNPSLYKGYNSAEEMFKDLANEVHD